MAGSGPGYGPTIARNSRNSCVIVPAPLRRGAGTRLGGGERDDSGFQLASAVTALAPLRDRPPTDDVLRGYAACRTKGSLHILHAPDNTKGPIQGPFVLLAVVTVHSELVSGNFPVIGKITGKSYPYT